MYLYNVSLQLCRIKLKEGVDFCARLNDTRVRDNIYTMQTEIEHRLIRLIHLLNALARTYHYKRKLFASLTKLCVLKCHKGG